MTIHHLPRPQLFDAADDLQSILQKVASRVRWFNLTEAHAARVVDVCRALEKRTDHALKFELLELLSTGEIEGRILGEKAADLFDQLYPAPTEKSA